ncbi:MAG: transcriptional regulator [Bacteroidia bacterium]
MNYEEGKEKFIEAWGTLGSSWGINRTMASIHALLLISPEPLSTEEIMAELNISRGNANMNIRMLIDWGIVYKKMKTGERKEYFASEKDIWTISKQIIRERRKRELGPMLKVLEELHQVPVEDSAKSREFKKMTKTLEQFAGKADNALEKMIKADEHWFLGSFLNIFK